MRLQISNTNDLLEFIKRDDVSVSLATKVIREALKVNVLLKYTKPQLISDVEHYVNTYCKKELGERPLFLDKNTLDIGNRN